eukprot:scaffold2339_cov54-Attheya_sp.AAC.1
MAPTNNAEVMATHRTCNQQKKRRRRATRLLLALLILGGMTVGNYRPLSKLLLESNERLIQQADLTVMLDASQREPQWSQSQRVRIRKQNEEWKVLGSYDAPYNRMAPRLHVVWARGWYNVVGPRSSVPLDYYNKKGLGGGAHSPQQLAQWFSPNTTCGTIWLRSTDLSWWANHILPKLKKNCNITLISSDNAQDTPNKLGEDVILASPHVHAWYSTNVVKKNHTKLFPIPLGIPIHYGFPDSPDSVHTIQKMIEIRQNSTPFLERKSTILYDVGTVDGGSGRRSTLRKQASDALAKCGNSNIENMPKGTAVESWPRYSAHQFAIAAAGVGWDTYRFWEYLFFGTVPIVMSSPIDDLLVKGHVPVVIVHDWAEVCNMTGATYDALIQKYKGWIANAPYWLEPSLWVPRNQTAMDRLCDISPGCDRSTTTNRK